MFDAPASDDVIAAALAEDLGVTPARMLDAALAGPDLLERDVTSAAVVPDGLRFSGRVVFREPGVVCGLPVLERTFELLARAAGAPAIECFPLVAEGTSVTAGASVAEIEGPARVVLAAERTALDFMMVLSAIATEARRWSEAAAGAIEVTDTRKTLPGLRALSKYAVRVGGAANHRSGLWDMVLIKDNHIACAGSIEAAVSAARARFPGLQVECEADTPEQAAEAARAGADAVLLDNMDDATLARAVAALRTAAEGRPCIAEVSGGVTFERLSALAHAGVDRVSTSALAFARPLDVGLDAD